MPINYAERFESQIEEQYSRELTSADFYLNRGYRFIDAQTIKVAELTVSGYKDHARDGSKNRGSLGNAWIPYRLRRDRDIEFYVDELDVDETNQVLTAANVTATFNTQEAIPETDKYNYSTLYTDWVALGNTPDSTALTEENILKVFDDAMQAMDEAGVPQEGRKMKVTPTVNGILKRAQGIQRTLEASGNKNIVRLVHSLDEVEIKMVPSDRLKTVYDFTEGAVPGITAEQINFILYHNSAIIAVDKIKDVYLWPKGSTPESAYGWLYQNRAHGDCMPVRKKAVGIAFNVTAGEVVTEPDPDPNPGTGEGGGE